MKQQIYKRLKELERETGMTRSQIMKKRTPWRLPEIKTLQDQVLQYILEDLQ